MLAWFVDLNQRERRTMVACFGGLPCDLLRHDGEEQRDSSAAASQPMDQPVCTIADRAAADTYRGSPRPSAPPRPPIRRRSQALAARGRRTAW